MNQSAKKWGLFALRWGIAALGIWYVVTNISWRDRALVLNASNIPVEMRLAAPDDETSPTLAVLDETNAVGTVERSQLVNEADRDKAQIYLDDGSTKPVSVLAVDLTPDLQHARRVLIADPADATKGQWIEPYRFVGGYQVRVPFPLVQAGLGHMLQTADRFLLACAILIFPVTFLITGVRWHLLLIALDIRLGLARAFVINMVGAFYNTFLPGSTGGDALKAWYAAKHTTYRTRAVMSVIIDRAIGLLALVIMGGVMAAFQWDVPACRQVAVGSAIIVAAVAVGLLVFYTPWLRRMTGLDFILRRLPMQRQVTKAVEAMEIYRRRPWLVLATLVMTFPVHITVVISAMLAGMAFDLPLAPRYYFVVVPVVVLAGAVPISPQGAGVMEFFAIVLTRRAGCTVSQAFALTMSIRLVQMLWNLVGGVFVFRGGYHAPTEAEQETLSSDDAPPGAAPLPPPPDSPEPIGAAATSRPWPPPEPEQSTQPASV
jgi:glycosyltransferase 2 family protein